MKGAPGHPPNGTPHLARDGIFRMINYATSPPTVIDARPLTPDEMDEFFSGIRFPLPDIFKGVDGTKVPREQWFALPPECLLEEDRKQ